MCGRLTLNDEVFMRKGKDRVGGLMGWAVAFGFVIGMMWSLPAAAQEKPQLFAVQLQEADSLLAHDQVKKAEKVYKKILKRESGSVEALRGLSQIALHKGDWGKVKKWNKKILESLPGDLEAQYWLGVAYRNTGMKRTVLFRQRDFGKSQKYFDSVIASDSSFRDVFYQRALLERRREHWTKAIEWGIRQITLKPADVHSRVGLYELYDLFLRHKGDKDVSRYLAGKSDPRSLYFLGENHRLRKRFATADSVFQALLRKDGLASKMRLYLSLVRLKLQQDDEKGAETYLAATVDSIQSDLDAAFLFEDTKYIFTDEELQRFEALSGPDAKRAFFRAFWAKRDPTPAAPVNVRAMEHFRRMVYAEKRYWDDDLRTWADNPDRVSQLRFPRAYYLNEVFSDRGLIYIRHGEPDETALTGDGGVVKNESWHYFQREDRPELIFHFLGRHWRLAPVITSPAMLADRQGWSITMDRLARARSINDASGLVHEMAIESEDDVYTALSSDAHTWDKSLEELDMSHYWSFFRGDSGRSRLELYVGIRVDSITADRLVDRGATIHDADFRLLHKVYEPAPIQLQKPWLRYKRYYIRRYTFSLAPGTYHLGFYAQQEVPPKVGGGTFEIDVPDFSGEGLGMSDLKLAYASSPEKKGEQESAEQTLIPNPSRKYSTSEPVVVYYEVYNLHKDDGGETSFRVQNKIIRAGKKKKILALFNKSKGGKNSISVDETRTGSRSDWRDVVRFDVSRLEKGHYQLGVKITDLHSGQSVEKLIDLQLVEE
ncbi:MAG: GWxTD domain-containing protein [Calditrichaeota bacterium]|nr:MAG: GWxTD domain-containing protein [Calditrichota bacterium]